MTKVRFVKRITNILLAIMLCVSLLLFCACSEKDDDNKPVLKIVYRPYSTSKISLFSDKTYIDAIYEKLRHEDYPLYRKMMVNEYEVAGNCLEQKEFLVQDPDGYLLRFTQKS